MLTSYVAGFTLSTLFNYKGNKVNTGKAVLEALYIKRKNQKWLCGQLNCSPAYVSGICLNKKALGRNKMIQIADIFGMTLSEFIALGE